MSVKKRILIVDDDDALREELTSQFAFFDEFETTAVANATDGIKAAEDEDFDAIVLDIDLPDITRIYINDPFGNRIELLEIGTA